MAGCSKYTVLVVCCLVFVIVVFQNLTQWTDSFEFDAKRDDKHNGNTDRTYRYVHPTSHQRGKPISAATQKAFDDLNYNYNSANLLQELHPDITDKFVFVTGATTDHFKAARQTVASIQTAFKGRKIYFYDLGLDQKLRDEIQTWCDVELIRFDYTKYPAHVSNLFTYAFKSLIIAEVLESHPGVFWTDSIGRLYPYDLNLLYEHARKSQGFLFFQATASSIFSITHKGMYTYIPTNIETLKQQDMWAASFMLYYRTEYVVRNLLLPAVMCSLDRQCIAPTRALICPVRLLYMRERYIGCHRYDQSMINILVLNAYNYDQIEIVHNSSMLRTAHDQVDKFKPCVL